MPRRLLLTLLVLFLIIPVAQTQDMLTGLVNVDQLNILSAPGGDVIVTWERGIEVNIDARDESGTWVRVSLSGVRGWTAAVYLHVFGDVMTLPLATADGGSSGGTLPPASNNGGGMMISRLNVRSGAGTNNSVLAQISARTRIIIEGRNTIGDWVLIHTEDNNLRGWVASRYVAFDEGVDLNNLPVVNGEVQAVTGNSSTDDKLTVNVPPLVIGTPEQMQARLESTPVLHNITGSTVYSIYARGQRNGNNPRVFMKVGDSMTASQPFMEGFGIGWYDLGPYGHLQATIDYFSVSPMPGVANSFVRNSMTAKTGFTSGAVFDSLWVNPNECDRVPLSCEYLAMKPSVAIILFGSQDLQLFSVEMFNENMHRIVANLKDWGVIPILTTFPSHRDYHWDEGLIFNNIILDVAQHHQVPLINLWRETQSMPDYGITTSDYFHLSFGWDNYYTFNGDEAIYGVTARNLLTLQALDELRQSVLR